MTIFTSLVDALHAGYEVLGRVQGGYLVRLNREDGTGSFGIIMLKPKSEPLRSAAPANDHFSEPNSADPRGVDSYLADFALAFDHGVPVVKVKGDINVSNVAAFKVIVHFAAMTDSHAIVVALIMTEHVCRGAYRILAGLQARLERAGRCVCISCDPSCVPRRAMIFPAVRFPIFDTTDDAVAALLPRTSMSQRNEFRNAYRPKRA